MPLDVCPSGAMRREEPASAPPSQPLGMRGEVSGSPSATLSRSTSGRTRLSLGSKPPRLPCGAPYFPSPSGSGGLFQINGGGCSAWVIVSRRLYLRWPSTS